MNQSAPRPSEFGDITSRVRVLGTNGGAPTDALFMPATPSIVSSTLERTHV